MYGGGIREGLAHFRKSPPAMLGLGIVAALSLFALVGPALSRHDPNVSDFSLERDHFGAPPGPSWEHWLGADHLLRDVFARLAVGARVSLSIALLATLLTIVVGALVGIAAGMTAEGRFRAIDEVLMRFVDVLLALPFLLFVLAIGVAVGRADVGTILLILGLTGWAGTARLCRAKTLQILQLEFVTAARALGARPLWIVTRHVIPNLTGSLIAVAGASAAAMIPAEAVLSYLTVGIQPPRATWGRMLHEGEPYLGTRFALIALPGFAILLATIGFHRIGEGLREALAPRAPGQAAGGAPGGRARLPVDLLLTAAAMLLLSTAAPNGVPPPLGRAPEPPALQRGGVLKVATLVNLRSLDPALADDEVWRSMSQLCFARLVDWDTEGRIVPDLAREVIPAPAGSAYTFELREGLRFHDGTPLTARDVKRSLERLLDPRTPTPAASFYSGIKGYADFHQGRSEHLEGVRVTGDRTVTIELSKPDATFLPKLTLPFAAPVCASAGSFADPSSASLPCGAGPFRVEAWEPDQIVRFARFEGYHQPGRPYLDGIAWSLHVPSASQRYKFERGELDYVRDLASRDSVLYEASGAWAGRFRWTATQGTNGIFMNTEVPPFDNRALRRAVAMAIDPSVLSRVRSDIVVADRVVPRSVPGPAERPPMRRHDVAGALAEMERAGYPFDPRTGRGGYPHEIDYLAVPDTGDQADGEIWQQQLGRIGIRLRLRLVTYAAFLTEVGRRRTAPMGKAGWTADFPDASDFFEPILSTEAIQEEGSNNTSFFSSAELDALLLRAHSDPDLERRFAAYERAEEIIRDEAPWVPAHAKRVFEIWQPCLRGYQPHPMILARFNDVWLDRSAGSAAALGIGRRPPIRAALLGAR
jgi:ABC-type dipeptide/oligopeptide/nickel transport system permease subunit/ABC-type transport system substrate-binding protein